MSGEYYGPMNGQNGRHYTFAGTPSSQSSREPSREPSRDPSPSSYLYRAQKPIQSTLNTVRTGENPVQGFKSGQNVIGSAQSGVNTIHSPQSGVHTVQSPQSGVYGADGPKSTAEAFKSGQNVIGSSQSGINVVQSSENVVKSVGSIPSTVQSAYSQSSTVGKPVYTARSPYNTSSVVGSGGQSAFDAPSSMQSALNVQTSMQSGQTQMQSPIQNIGSTQSLMQSTQSSMQSMGSVQNRMPNMQGPMQSTPTPMQSTFDAQSLVQSTLNAQTSTQSAPKPMQGTQNLMQNALSTQSQLHSTQASLQSIASSQTPMQTVASGQAPMKPIPNVQNPLQSPPNVRNPIQNTSVLQSPIQSPSNPLKPPQNTSIPQNPLKNPSNFQNPAHHPSNLQPPLQNPRNTMHYPLNPLNPVQSTIHPQNSFQSTINSQNPMQNTFNQQNSFENTMNPQNPVQSSSIPQNPMQNPSNPQNPYQAPRSLASQKYIRNPYNATALQTHQTPPNPSQTLQTPLSPNFSSTLHGNVSSYPATNQIHQMNQLNAQMSGQSGRIGQMNQLNAQTNQINQLNAQMSNMTVSQTGFNKLWGMEAVDLLQNRNILPPDRIEPPKINLKQEFLDSVNCSPEIFRCTLTRIPETNSLLQKSRLPLGVLIHPFKDVNNLPVIHSSIIVRCRACRTYINPFVYFVDSKRWKCNLCYRVNELPEEFLFDPVTKSYGDPSRRPEIRSSTIEFIAPTEYMLRPPQPAVYVFVLDVSRFALESDYLRLFCQTLSEELHRLPGDGRTQLGFIAFDSAIHFFCMPEIATQPQEIVLLDIEDVFLPCPDNLIVNLKEREELIRDLLVQLPTKFEGTMDTGCALGAALQAAHKLVSPTGGRITVFQTCLPNLGPGSLQPREDPNNRTSKDVQHLNPATDFYKRLALDCSGQQIAVDLFLLNGQYCDLATLSGVSKFSAGEIHHLPLFKSIKPSHSTAFVNKLRRYLTRKIGFEAVMRVRCTRGLTIHTFHGNFFVRSTDLLSLPNVNPDAGFGMQIAIEESLVDAQTVCLQAALLYTSSKGERRIRVHTLCLPVANNLSDILHSADQQCIVGLLARMAVDRSQQSSLTDARDALINVAVDVLSAYKLSNSSLGHTGLPAPTNLKLLPLYILSLLKCIAFRSGTNTRLDDRLFSMLQLKTLPLSQLIQMIYPDLYPLLSIENAQTIQVEDKICPILTRLHLSAEKIDSRGLFLIDSNDKILIYVGRNCPNTYVDRFLGVGIAEDVIELPELETKENELLRNFVWYLQDEKPAAATIQIIRDESQLRSMVFERLIEDRHESALSYYEFLQYLKTQVKQ